MFNKDTGCLIMIHQHIHYYEVTLYWGQLLHLCSKAHIFSYYFLGNLNFSSGLTVFSFNIFLKIYNENICVLLSLQISAKLEKFVFCYIHCNNITWTVFHVIFQYFGLCRTSMTLMWAVWHGDYYIAFLCVQVPWKGN